MDLAQAKALIQIHGYTHPGSLRDPEIKQVMDRGFLGMLRPYKGELHESNFHELMRALRVVGPEFSKPQVDTQLMSALWGICALARWWGIEPDGMLQRNQMLDEQETEALRDWVHEISYVLMLLLDGESVEVAFQEYNRKYQR